MQSRIMADFRNAMTTYSKDNKSPGGRRVGQSKGGANKGKRGREMEGHAI